MTTGSLTAACGQRLRCELREFVREPAAVGFTVLFPLIMLVLFGSIFDKSIPGTSTRYSQLYVANIIGSALLSVGVVAVAIGIAVERDSGMLKRLAGTPMPKVAYFIGKAGMVIILSLVEIALMLIAGVILFDLSLPTSPGRIGIFAAVLVVGGGAATMLGIAIGGLVPSAKSAPAILNVPFVVLQFASGIFIPFDQLPRWLYGASAAFPLRWIAQGMRSVFLPDDFQHIEVGGSWQHGIVFAVLAAWCVIGAFIASRTFRWVGRER
jgi:ABC-2 type transport system permease protein